MRTATAAATNAATLLLSLAAAARAERADPSSAPVSITVDLTDIQRGLAHSVLTIPASPGPLDLYYVEWTPGNHNPSGPIQNVVDFYVRDSAGRALDWRRDPTHVHRVTLDVPAGSPTVTVNLSYIANQPAVNSRSTDTYGKPTLGGLNWNTVLVYPGAADKDEIIYEPTLILLDGWRCATALRERAPGADADNDAPHGALSFEPVTLAMLVDSPVIFGEHLATFDIETAEDAPLHFFHGVAKDPAQLKLPEARLAKFGEMLRQAERIFGPFPYSQFHFLNIVASDVPGFGVEHKESTYISMGDDEFKNAETDKGGPMTVVPHEYIHAWNGKLRVPDGLLAPNYHTPALTQLMWVYEGLTTYYTDVLAVRCGLLDEEKFIHRLAGRINTFELQAGRRWRSVEDTASALRFLRATSDTWDDLRRRQDYYSEGALFWMEADAIIRAGSTSGQSLDDFTRAFFNPSRPATYTRGDVVDALAAVYPGHDWKALIEARIERPQHSLQIADLPARLGWRMEYADEPTDLQKKDSTSATGANLRNSIGLSVDKDGRITSVVPGSAADAAKLGYGMRIVAVHDPHNPDFAGPPPPDVRLYTPARLIEAVKQSRTSRTVTLVITRDGDTLETIGLDYHAGHRHPRLTRDESKPDILRAIAQPR